jgi:hypothetical protein
LVTSDSTLDLSHSTVTGFFVASANSTGTTFTVHDPATAFAICGGPGQDTIVATDLTFTVDQRNAIFTYPLASIEKIVDSSGAYTPAGALPTITSNGGSDTSVVSVIENTTAVTTVTATDPDAGQTLSYSIIGGADASNFTIGSSTGVLSFVSAPNFELPTDADRNNIYDVTVRVSDGHGAIDTQAIAVSVNDRDEGHAVTTVPTGDFNSNGMQEYVGRDSSAFMTKWEYDATAQKVTAADLGSIGFSWHILASDHFSDAGTAQMLTQNVDDGTMTLWWVGNGALSGINLGQRWINVDYVTAGQFTTNGETNFLVNNTVDHHLYDWWIDANNTLQGIDLGPYWSNVGLVATGHFTSNGGTSVLVNNTIDHHLYDWWIGANGVLQGVDLGAYWSNVALVATGQFTANGSTNLLVTNTVDQHLYDWWIDPTSHTLQGIDLGAYWSNIELLASGHFSNHTTNDELLVRNTVDNHLYEWWITPQHTLTGIDLGPMWSSNLQIIDSGHFNNANNSSTNDELLVHNNADGHFYEWWISNNQLSGGDLGNAWHLV